MQRAASDVMQSILLSAVIDALEAMKAASKGVPNMMLRDLQSVHRNTTFADLPKPVQDSIAQSVRAAFTQLLKEGYAVGPQAGGPAIAADGPGARAPARAVRNDRRGPPRGPGRSDPRPARDGPGGKAGGDRPGGPPKGKPTQVSGSPADLARAVIQFWCEELSPEQHWKKDPALDRHIAERFGKVREEVLRTKAAGWRDTPETLAAAIILLDQFSRNMFRGQGQGVRGGRPGAGAVQGGAGQGLDRQAAQAAAELHADAAPAQRESGGPGAVGGRVPRAAIRSTTNMRSSTATRSSASAASPAATRRWAGSRTPEEREVNRAGRDLLNLDLRTPLP